MNEDRGPTEDSWGSVQMAMFCFVFLNRNGNLSAHSSRSLWLLSASSISAAQGSVACWAPLIALLGAGVSISELCSNTHLRGCLEAVALQGPDSGFMALLRLRTWEGEAKEC